MRRIGSWVCVGPMMPVVINQIPTSADLSVSLNGPSFSMFLVFSSCAGLELHEGLWLPVPAKDPQETSLHGSAS